MNVGIVLHQKQKSDNYVTHKALVVKSDDQVYEIQEIRMHAKP